MSFIICKKTDNEKYKPVPSEFSEPNFCFESIKLAKKLEGNNLKVMIKQGIKFNPLLK